ncbi:MAG: hypothetical protein ACI89X_001009 [Planctomycetota bacterium]|jgi:hypothetical protein
MRRLLAAWFGLFALCVSAIGQQQNDTLIYREFSLVTRLRVVCSNAHFGRIDDLVINVPSGRITAAIVTFDIDRGSRRVTVPYAELKYDAAANCMSMPVCREDTHPHNAFEPNKLQLRRRPASKTVPASITGSVLASSLRNHAVALKDGVASVQGIELELRHGRIGFFEIAIGRKQAGDRDLHPAPWAAFAWRPQATEGNTVKAAITMAHSKLFIEETPNLIEIIIPDPLRRARVYAAFGITPKDKKRSP